MGPHSRHLNPEQASPGSSGRRGRLAACSGPGLWHDLVEEAESGRGHGPTGASIAAAYSSAFGGSTARCRSTVLGYVDQNTFPRCSA
jgi:hypothetical protein